nr:DUF6530 family protein [Plesiomonas shigelloides]
MPIKEFGDRKEYVTTPELPHHLEHTPLFAMPYEKFDGIYIGNTDARYLSVGLSQWDSRVVSLKIMRHTGDKWTRQAEELPLHRVIDSTIFLTKVLLDESEGVIEIERNLFLEQNSGIQVTKENCSKSDYSNYENYLNNNIPMLKSRLKSLYLLLDGLEKKGKL